MDDNCGVVAAGTSNEECLLSPASRKRLRSPSDCPERPSKTPRAECAICLEDMSGTALGKLDRCAHVFCLVCIRSWIEVDSTCPQCRSTIKQLQVERDGADAEAIPVEARAQRGDDDSGDESSAGCTVCAQSNRPHELLLCDSCDSAYHMRCLTPPLHYDTMDWDKPWYCPPCEAGHARTRETEGQHPSTQEAHTPGVSMILGGSASSESHGSSNDEDENTTLAQLLIHAGHAAALFPPNPAPNLGEQDSNRIANVQRWETENLRRATSRTAGSRRGRRQKGRPRARTVRGQATLSTVRQRLAHRLKWGGDISRERHELRSYRDEVVMAMDQSTLLGRASVERPSNVSGGWGSGVRHRRAGARAAPPPRETSLDGQALPRAFPGRGHVLGGAKAMDRIPSEEEVIWKQQHSAMKEHGEEQRLSARTRQRGAEMSATPSITSVTERDPPSNNKVDKKKEKRPRPAGVDLVGYILGESGDWQQQPSNPPSPPRRKSYMDVMTAARERAQRECMEGVERRSASEEKKSRDEACPAGGKRSELKLDKHSFKKEIFQLVKAEMKLKNLTKDQYLGRVNLITEEVYIKEKREWPRHVPMSLTDHKRAKIAAYIRELH